MTEANNPVVTCEGVDVVRGGTPILSDVSLSVTAQDAFLVQGPSGSGKTTLFHVLGLLSTPDAGSLSINGTEVSQLPERRRAEIRGRTIGLIFQDFQLVPDLTAWENARLPQQHRHLNTPGVDWLTTVFDQLDILDLKQQYPATLSGGEKQRVAAARALANKPMIVLADEPTGQLDPDSTDALLTLLQRVQSEVSTALGIISHDRSLRTSFSTVYTIQNGTLNTSQ